MIIEVDFERIGQRNLINLLEMEKPNAFDVSYVHRYVLLARDAVGRLVHRSSTQSPVAD